MTFEPTALPPMTTIVPDGRTVLTLHGEGWEAVAGRDAKRDSDESVLGFVNATHPRVEIRVEQMTDHRMLHGTQKRSGS